MDDLVVGDIVHLSAGDMIPADVRILDAKDLFVSQASLTGESEPVEKLPHVSPHKDSVTAVSYTHLSLLYPLFLISCFHSVLCNNENVPSILLSTFSFTDYKYL